ncbi:hypothetical protein [Staphylococcus gallinarum]|uniref:hypothetical protein n=1 Tax=Staphylococcus gallinarum TaxID=1293 RepID=UPI001C716B1A|nr:hypothetical protein [Staphylococcus gallinarum]MEB6054405.1 hypothetical protein [Staphylococcus gallinarum]MEB7040132.1 hypothetical protein [Staphylococcus gallinarum]UEH01062.1 hypothetical protein K3U27_01665 [Staphylococcus gallinarum]
MITVEFIKQNLECSDIYAKKIIEWANGDEKKAYYLFIQKLNERHTRPAIREVK